MRAHTTIIALGAVLALTGSGCVGTAYQPRTVKETRTINVPHISSSALQVTTGNGAVTVEAIDRDDVELVATLRATTAERLTNALVVAERDRSNTLVVRVDWPGGKPRNNEGCDFKILLPDAKGATIRTSNGSVAIVGLEGTADLRTSNGRLEVRNHGGDVKVHTSNGPVSVKGAAGAVDAGTSNGSASVSEVEGAITVRTSNGKVEILEAKRSVTAGTSNGSIEIRLAQEGGGPVEAKTSNGGVTLAVGEGFTGELDLRTSNSSIRIDDLPGATTVADSKRHKQLRFGASDNQSHIETSNGSIRVRAR